MNLDTTNEIPEPSFGSLLSQIEGLYHIVKMLRDKYEEKVDNLEIRVNTQSAQIEDFYATIQRDNEKIKALSDTIADLVTNNNSRSEFMQDVVDEYELKSKISAIKFVREKTNLGLKEAKELVEKICEKK